MGWRVRFARVMTVSVWKEHPLPGACKVEWMGELPEDILAPPARRPRSRRTLAIAAPNALDADEPPWADSMDGGAYTSSRRTPFSPGRPVWLVEHIGQDDIGLTTQVGRKAYPRVAEHPLVGRMARAAARRAAPCRRVALAAERMHVQHHVLTSPRQLAHDGQERFIVASYRHAQVGARQVAAPVAIELRVVEHTARVQHQAHCIEAMIHENRIILVQLTSIAEAAQFFGTIRIRVLKTAPTYALEDELLPWLVLCPAARLEIASGAQTPLVHDPQFALVGEWFKGHGEWLTRDGRIRRRRRLVAVAPTHARPTSRATPTDRATGDACSPRRAARIVESRHMGLRAGNVTTKHVTSIKSPNSCDAHDDFGVLHRRARGGAQLSAHHAPCRCAVSCADTLQLTERV